MARKPMRRPDGDGNPSAPVEGEKKLLAAVFGDPVTEAELDRSDHRLALQSAQQLMGAPDSIDTVKNIIPGTTLHLGDGRRLAFGESAKVSPALAAFLLERGQAE